MRFPLAVLLAFCGLAVTSAEARPRLVADRISEVGTGGEFTLQKSGSGVLAGLVIVKPEAVTRELTALSDVEVKSLGEDRYGRDRLLLYRTGAKQPLQVDLLAAGSAIAYDRMAIPKTWMKAEAQARAARRGMWAEENFILKPEETSQHIGAFRMVEGKMTRSYKSREMHYLNFGEDWKQDFSLRIPRRAWRSFGKNFAVAEGQCIRARGAIFLDNGPMIEITRPEQLEVSDADTCRG